MKNIVCKNAYGEEFLVTNSELETRVGVYALIEQNDKILFTKQWGGYGIVGGGVDLSETLEGALVREVREETGLEVTPGELFYYTTTFYKKDADSQAYQSHQFYFTVGKIKGDIGQANITVHEQSYTQGTPEWVSKPDLRMLDFRHSVDLATILDAYYRRLN